jgi:hypothetical protein
MARWILPVVRSRARTSMWGRLDSQVVSAHMSLRLRRAACEPWLLMRSLAATSCSFACTVGLVGAPGPTERRSTHYTALGDGCQGSGLGEKVMRQTVTGPGRRARRAPSMAHAPASGYAERAIVRWPAKNPACGAKFVCRGHPLHARADKGTDATGNAALPASRAHVHSAACIPRPQ